MISLNRPFCERLLDLLARHRHSKIRTVKIMVFGKDLAMATDTEGEVDVYFNPDEIQVVIGERWGDSVFPSDLAAFNLGRLVSGCHIPKATNIQKLAECIQNTLVRADGKKLDLSDPKELAIDETVSTEPEPQLT